MTGIERVTIPYSPRAIFAPFHASERRWAVLVTHRRAGKTVACINRLIRSAIECRLPDARCAYVAPQFNQAKDVVWGYLKRFTAPIPGAVANEAELRVDLPNGARIRLYGADNYDRLRGGYFDDIVLDEYADIDPRAWTEVIRPALSDRGGRAVFIGTPRGRNAFYQLCYGSPDGSTAGAANDPDWYFALHKAGETGIISAEELASARKTMPEAQYEQEYECSFQAAILGAYYGAEMTRAETDGRIRVVAWEPQLPVHTAWDLGIRDATAIWFCQQSGREVRLIDYYEASGHGLDHYAKVLKEKPYVYGNHLLPHDASVQELGSGLSRVSTLRSLGVNPRVLDIHKVADGINATRLLIARAWFDSVKCRRGVDALRLYRQEFDTKLNAFRGSPLHDWTSHAADALRYLAAGLRHSDDAQRQSVADSDYNVFDVPRHRGGRQAYADEWSPT